MTSFLKKALKKRTRVAKARRADKLKAHQRALGTSSPRGAKSKIGEESLILGRRRRDAADFAKSTFPGPDCVTDHEFDLYRESADLPRPRMAHALNCAGCRALLGMAVPSEKGMEQVASDTRDLATRLHGMALRQVQKAPRDGLPKALETIRVALAKNAEKASSSARKA